MMKKEYNESHRQRIIKYFTETKTQRKVWGSDLLLDHFYDGRLDGVIAVMNIIDPQTAENLLGLKNVY